MKDNMTYRKGDLYIVITNAQDDWVWVIIMGENPCNDLADGRKNTYEAAATEAEKAFRRLTCD
jgi:hypothetical protein